MKISERLSQAYEILKREIFQKMTIQKREHFRIEYPTEERAILLLNNVQFDVIDISQSGIRFLSPVYLPKVGQIFLIKIVMLHGYKHITKAKVIGLNNREVMLTMQGHLDRYEIDLEKVYLTKKYGHFRSAPVF